MFRRYVEATPFVNEDSNILFKRIKAVSQLSTDVSFLSTLRALVFPRMSETDTLSFAYFTDNKFSDIAEEAKDVIYVVNPATSDNNTIECIKDKIDAEIKASEEEIKKGFEPLPIITKFFENKFKVYCWINKTARLSYILCDNIDIRGYHYIQCSIPVVLPWYFAENKCSDEEKELIVSLKDGRSSEKYSKSLDVIIRKYDFKEIRIKRLLGDFETKAIKDGIKTLEDAISAAESKVENYLTMISVELKNKRNAQLKLTGYKHTLKTAGEDSPMADFFINSNNIELVDINGSTIDFIAKGYMSLFDEDEAESCIDNEDSFVYVDDDYCELRDDGWGDDEREALMRAIFVYRTVKLLTCAAYRFADSTRVSGISDYNFGSGYEDYYPNPHIYHYSCLGDYSSYIAERLRDGDYIGAINQAQASAISLSWHDGAVMSKFFNDIYSTDRKCIEFSDGTRYTPAEAAKLLLEKED